MIWIIIVLVLTNIYWIVGYTFSRLQVSWALDREQSLIDQSKDCCFECKCGAWDRHWKYVYRRTVK